LEEAEDMLYACLLVEKRENEYYGFIDNAPPS
jgi:hypothetical protein